MSPNKSPQGIKKAFDELLQRLEDIQRADQLLKKFHKENPQPVPPDTFQSASDLADYLQRKEEFDEKYASQRQQTTNFNERYKEAAEKVTKLLPDNTPLIHDYQGVRYTITHVPGGRSAALGGTGGTPEILVETQGESTEGT